MGFGLFICPVQGRFLVVLKPGSPNKQDKPALTKSVTLINVMWSGRIFWSSGSFYFWEWLHQSQIMSWGVRKKSLMACIMCRVAPRVTKYCSDELRRYFIDVIGRYPRKSTVDLIYTKASLLNYISKDREIYRVVGEAFDFCMSCQWENEQKLGYWRRIYSEIIFVNWCFLQTRDASSIQYLFGTFGKILW